MRIAWAPAGAELPNGLDVWRHWTLMHGGMIAKTTKVLNVRWRDGEAAIVVSYNGGRWEQYLERPTA